MYLTWSHLHLELQKAIQPESIRSSFFLLQSQALPPNFPNLIREHHLNPASHSNCCSRINFLKPIPCIEFTPFKILYFLFPKYPSSKTLIWYSKSSKTCTRPSCSPRKLKFSLYNKNAFHQVGRDGRGGGWGKGVILICNWVKRKTTKCARAFSMQETAQTHFSTNLSS